MWFSEWFNSHINPKITAINAFLSSKILNLLGQGTSSGGETIFSPAFSISVARGCDGVEAMAIFAAALLSFPIPWRKKIPGVFIGIFLLFLLNLIRIVSLFLTGVYYPSLSEVMHTEVWQVVFILAAVALWAAWIYRSTKAKGNESKADDS
jgi:exosortase/archaeosortase family protein